MTVLLTCSGHLIVLILLLVALGHGQYDRVPDQCPKYRNHHHIKLGCGDSVKTSYAMLIQKPSDANNTSNLDTKLDIGMAALTE
jgi:hypothetical protein